MADLSLAADTGAKVGYLGDAGDADCGRYHKMRCSRLFNVACLQKLSKAQKRREKLEQQEVRISFDEQPLMLAHEAQPLNGKRRHT